MITVIIGGVKVLCFKAFIGWGAFVTAFLGLYGSTPPVAQPPAPPVASQPAPTLPGCYVDAEGFTVCLPCRLIGGC